MRQIDNKIHYDSLCSDEREITTQRTHPATSSPRPELGVSERRSLTARSVSVVTRVTAMSLSHHKLNFLEVSLWPHWLVSC